MKSLSRFLSLSLLLTAPLAAITTITWTGDVADGNNNTGRAAADDLDDAWRVAASLASGAPSSAFETPDIFQSAVPTGSGVLTTTSSAFSTGLTLTISLHNTASGDTDQGTLHTSRSAKLNPSSGSLQDSAPIPSNILSHIGITEGSGSSSPPLNAFLIDFSQPVKNFGIFIGDLESRSSATLGEVRLFNSAGTMVGQQNLVYSGVVNGSSAYTETDDTGSTGSNNTLNRWGDDQTSFVGFSGTSNVASMLLVVGDDDFGDSGSSEHLSIIGATIVPEPGVTSLFLLTILPLLARRRRS